MTALSPLVLGAKDAEAFSRLVAADYPAVTHGLSSRSLAIPISSPWSGRQEGNLKSTGRCLPVRVTQLCLRRPIRPGSAVAGRPHGFNRPTPWPAL
jgi:hypothetical protein